MTIISCSQPCNVLTCFGCTQDHKSHQKQYYLMAKWICSRCGYTYTEETGDIERGIQPNTPFEILPESWVCPRCKAEKETFQKMG